MPNKPDKPNKLKALEELPNTGYVRMGGFLPFFGFSKATFYRCVAKGIFPAPIKWGRASLWRAEDIRNILENFDDIANKLNESKSL